ncbi:MAG TPA: peptidase C39 family protein [Bosea sp. (in: a-proteobacteria)]|jgi:hypothetical protein|uniref:peptidase C39 family protein n=1 Tax=Bosea sp. (in: a-proteobacteria) TaxID=1871050 RepID=UPI002E0D6D9D|nr:peptidase C39 family protein [Bosea sp. (in: a-proteobacteria)]
MHEPTADDAPIQRCVQALQPYLAEVVTKAAAFPGSILVCEWREDRLAGFVLGLARPTGALLRLRASWVAPGADAAEIARQLASQLETRSRSAGLLLWRRDAETLMDAELARLLGVEPTGQRWLVNTLSNVAGQVPYWRQTTRFTCGPASLMMGIGALQPGTLPDRHAEIALWREASSIAGLTGPGGCDPIGLALAADTRGFSARVFHSTDRPILLERVDTEEKRELVGFVQAEFRERAAAAKLAIEARPFSLEDVREALARGEVALVLINQRLTHGRDTPHWILVHGYEDGWFLVSDPWSEPERGESAADVSDLPVASAKLDAMAWFGEPPYRCAVMLGHRPTS